MAPLASNSEACANQLSGSGKIWPKPPMLQSLGTEPPFFFWMATSHIICRTVSSSCGKGHVLSFRIGWKVYMTSQHICVYIIVIQLCNYVWICSYIHTLLGSPEICVDMNSESSFKSLQDFPFDRHIISLKHCDFVWRTEKDDDDFFDSMQIVAWTDDAENMVFDEHVTTVWFNVVDKTIASYDTTCARRTSCCGETPST